ILLILPIYALFPHPLTLLFLQTIFLALAAYPLYLLARLRLGNVFALLISVSYLLYPPLGFMNIFETHFEIYAIFFLFFALYYFEKENFKKFLIFILLAISCKENVSLVVFMLGIYAFLRRRSRKWILGPSLLGLVWFFLAIKVVIPYFAKDAKLYQEGFIFSQYYKHLGSNLSEMIKTLITKPFWVFRYAFTERKLVYLFKLFFPTALLGFLSPSVLLIIFPILLQNLLSAVDIHTSIYFHYNALLIPFIFYSAINGFKKLLRFKIINNHTPVIYVGFLGVLAISGVYLRGPQFYLPEFVNFYPIDDIAKEKEKLIRMIPKDAPVIATFQFLPRLASRHNVYSMHFVASGFRMLTNEKYEPPENLEYALIDFNEPLPAYTFSMAWAHYNLFSFLETGNWKVFKAIDDIVLFKKNMPKGDSPFELIHNPEIQNAIGVNINDKIILSGYKYVSYFKKERILHISYYWKFIKTLDKPLGLCIYFLDSENKVRFQKFHLLGYRVYATGDWPKDKIFKENLYIFIPSNTERGIYNARLSLFSMEDGKILPVLDKDKIDSYGRIILGSISLN
ncbi:MAG: DUF2079 domain-containing protein, partial [Candidatus Omnitrophica bacterium]|nr:DUF2079 domain-containing protein [Candidatus Omnitrophota bacterium]